MFCLPRARSSLTVRPQVPDLCTPEELLNCTNVLPMVDVCSPNHAELAGFMGDDGLDPETGEISTKAVEANCEQLLASMPLQSCTSLLPPPFSSLLPLVSLLQIA